LFASLSIRFPLLLLAGKLDEMVTGDLSFRCFATSMQKYTTNSYAGHQPEALEAWF
jgi:hypothetical protein